MTDPERRIVTVSSIFDETPESLYHLDQLQMAYDAQRREVATLLVDADSFDEAMVRTFIEGT